MRRILLYCTSQNVPCTRVWKGFSSVLALATETHVYDSASCAISLLPQILSAIQSLPISPKSPLQQFPLQWAHGKVQSLCESEETLWGWDAQNATAELEAAPRRKKKKEQGKSRDLSGPVQAKGNFFYQLPEEQALAGKWRTLAWKFPTCTSFLIALFSTTFY